MYIIVDICVGWYRFKCFWVGWGFDWVWGLFYDLGLKFGKNDNILLRYFCVLCSDCMWFCILYGLGCKMVGDVIVEN